MYIVFDIETGPVRDDVLMQTFEVDFAKVPNYKILGTEFDAASVKTGNLKDSTKIDEKIETERQKFKELYEKTEVLAASAKETQFAEYKARAALSPLTGQVLAIGYGFVDDSQNLISNEISSIADMDEGSLISWFFDLIENNSIDNTRFAGHNIRKFDLPFLIRRAWLLGIKVPEVLKNDLLLYHPCIFIDTMNIWGEMVKLDVLGQYFHTGRKNGDGALFYQHFLGTDDERTEAFLYLHNDVQMTFDIARKMEVFK